MNEVYKFEIDAGELADMVNNKHSMVPIKYAYSNLGRRSMPEYPDTEVQVSLFILSFHTVTES